MSITHIQHQFAFTDAVGQASIAAAFPGTVGNGNCVVAFLKHGATSTVSGVTDDKGNTYSLVDTQLGGAANANELRSYVARNITNAPQTVTASYTGSNGVYPRLMIGEWSGADTTAAIVNAHEAASQTAPGAGADAITSAGTAATSVANCMLVAFAQDHDAQGGAGAALADGTGFTGLANGVTSPNFFDVSRLSNQILAVAGNAHATFSGGSTTPATEHYTAMLVALQPPQSGGSYAGTLVAGSKVLTGQVPALTLARKFALVPAAKVITGQVLNLQIPFIGTLVPASKVISGQVLQLSIVNLQTVRGGGGRLRKSVAKRITAEDERATLLWLRRLRRRVEVEHEREAEPQRAPISDLQRRRGERAATEVLARIREQLSVIPQAIADTRALYADELASLRSEIAAIETARRMRHDDALALLLLAA